ncbi:hypothetical protein IFR04_015891 [Cadophora malorum]|uniref:Bromo domain-containing protein n=1 Tax=Cadophora malorum TaxID=108018 RepID=A0A8H7SWW2_9HELO|nr:hypothetical protein IFR04_015891 [Cadophora malorum]
MESNRASSTATGLTQHQVKELVKIVKAAARSTSGKNFRAPIAELWPGFAEPYTEKIANQIDLKTMEKKLTLGNYISIEAFKADVDLLHLNAVTFNGAIHTITQAALETRTVILEKVKKIPSEPVAPRKKVKIAPVIIGPQKRKSSDINDDTVKEQSHKLKSSKIKDREKDARLIQYRSIDQIYPESLQSGSRFRQDQETLPGLTNSISDGHPIQVTEVVSRAQEHHMSSAKISELLGEIQSRSDNAAVTSAMLKAELVQKDQKIESLQLENASLTSKLKEFETSSSAAEERTKSLESSITHLSSYLNEQIYTLKSHLEEIKKIQSTMDSYLRQSRT